MNVLDLDYINSIQPLQHQKAPKTMVELITAVNDSCAELPVQNLTKILLNLAGQHDPGDDAWLR